MAPLLALALLVQPVSEATLAELERSYDQACLGRLYGQLDDVCSDLEGKVKAYRRELRRRPRGNGAPVLSAKPATPARTPLMPDQTSAPDPTPPNDPAAAAPSPAAPNGGDELVRAFEAVRDIGQDDDHAEIAADDAGATSLAEEIGARSQKP